MCLSVVLFIPKLLDGIEVRALCGPVFPHKTFFFVASKLETHCVKCHRMLLYDGRRRASYFRLDTKSDPIFIFTKVLIKYVSDAFK